MPLSFLFDFSFTGVFRDEWRDYIIGGMAQGLDYFVARQSVHIGMSRKTLQNLSKIIFTGIQCYFFFYRDFEQVLFGNAPKLNLNLLFTSFSA